MTENFVFAAVCLNYNKGQDAKNQKDFACSTWQGKRACHSERSRGISWKRNVRLVSLSCSLHVAERGGLCEVWAQDGERIVVWIFAQAFLIRIKVIIKHQSSSVWISLRSIQPASPPLGEAKGTLLNSAAFQARFRETFRLRSRWQKTLLSRQNA